MFKFQSYFNQLNTSKRLIFVLAIAILSIFFTIRWIFWSHSTIDTSSRKMVEIETIKHEPFQKTVRLLGIVHARHRAIMTAQVGGTFDAVIPSGQEVKKGTLIAKIDNADLEKNLNLAMHMEEMVKKQFERIEILSKKGYASQTQLEEQKQALMEAQKNVSVARMTLDSLRFYAPFDGIVGAYKKREGAQIVQGEAVVSMYDPTSVMVDFDIPCANLESISRNQKVRVAGKTYPLSSYQRMLDEDTHMCPADVEIHCPDCLMGSVIDVDLVVAEKPSTISIPFQAFFLRDSKPFVYLVRDGKIVLVPVKTGMQQENRIEIVEGLKPGEKLVIKGHDRLSPDMSVDIFTPESQKQTG